MRTATLTLSIVAHVMGACALIIAPLYATDTLPEPRTATEFIRVVPLATPTPPPVRLDRTPRVAAHRDAAPIEAPDGIRAEEPVEPVNDALRDDLGPIVFGSDMPVADFVPPPPSPPQPVRVGGDIRPPQRVIDVAPVYPAIARAAGVQGIVILEATIGEDGGVRDVRVLRSLPLLDLAAIDAVRQWRFTPTLLNGQPVPVVMTVTVAFKLR